MGRSRPYRGYDLYQPTSGGKAGKGHAKTSSIQVRLDNRLLTQFRYKVGDGLSQATAWKSAKQYADNHYKANNPEPKEQPPVSTFGDGTFKQELKDVIIELANTHKLDMFSAIEASMEVLSHLMINAFRKDEALKELYERAKSDAKAELVQKLST